MEVIGGFVVGIGVLLVYLSPLVVIVLAILAWKKLESHHRRMEAELLLLNQQIGRFLGGDRVEGRDGSD